MTGDPINRAHRPLPAGTPRQTQSTGSLLDHGNDLIARVKARRANSPSIYKPSAKLMRLMMTCGTNGKLYSLIVEQHPNDRMTVLGDQIPQAQQQGGSFLPPLLPGEYKFEFPDGWACPLCGNHTTWVCNCANFRGALHCGGPSGGTYHCA